MYNVFVVAFKEREKKNFSPSNPLKRPRGPHEPRHLLPTCGAPVHTVLGPLVLLPEWQIRQCPQCQEQQPKRNQVRHHARDVLYVRDDLDRAAVRAVELCGLVAEKGEDGARGAEPLLPPPVLGVLDGRAVGECGGGWARRRG